MVFEKIQEILSNQFDVDADSITADTDIVDDLGADSLDLVDMLMSLEDEFNIGEGGPHWFRSQRQHCAYSFDLP